MKQASDGTYADCVSIIRFLRARWREVQQRRDLARILARPSNTELSRADWSRSLTEPTAFYEDAVRFFHRNLPSELRVHRNYYRQRKRGFGEDAFHVLWFLLFREFKPDAFLEIGVYRGQTISLVALIAKLLDKKCFVSGISPFSSAGDSVSKYSDRIDYLEDTIRNFAHFSLPRPELVKGYSTDPEALKSIQSKRWPAIYIDGNHDYEVARQDWLNCAANTNPGGFIVLDDSSLDTQFVPPAFATAGHPGPTRVAAEVDPKEFQEILRIGHNRVFQRIS